LCPYKDYSSLLGDKLTIFTFCNYGFMLAKVCRVILELFEIILLFIRLILLFVAFVEILGLRVLILLFMTYFVVYASLGVSGHASASPLSE
jgi:hypothetical protein